MKRPSILLLYSQLVIIFFLSGLHCNANSGTCSISLEERERKEELHLELAMRAEELLKVPEIYNSEEGRTLTMQNIEIIRQWESSESSIFPPEQFRMLKENVKQLETLSTTHGNRETSENSDHSTAPQRPSHSLNSVVANDRPIEPNKLYTVEPLNGGHTFRVVFSEKVAQMINQNKTDIRIKKSIRALLTGPVQSSGGSFGIKKLTPHKNLFELKIIGNYTVGRFRIGIFLYDGVYHLEDYTYQHIEKTSPFIQILKRALVQSTEGRYPAYSL